MEHEFEQEFRLLGLKVAYYRKAKNMTQEQAAEAIGVSAQTISRWECNTTLPDVTILPRIATLYGVTIDDLYKETSMAYDNYAQRLGSVFEASLKPEDFIRADMEYQKLLKTEGYTTEDLRLYGILYQHMMYVCIKKTEEIFNRVIEKGVEADPQTYWAVQRQKGYFLWEIGRNQERKSCGIVGRTKHRNNQPYRIDRMSPTAIFHCIRSRFCHTLESIRARSFFALLFLKGPHYAFDDLFPNA